jgi:hypothetical protein
MATTTRQWNALAVLIFNISTRLVLTSLAQQQLYIRNFITFGKRHLSAGPVSRIHQTGYANYIDVPSFIDNMLLSELGKNVDGFRFSTYMYKRQGQQWGQAGTWPAVGL